MCAGCCHHKTSESNNQMVRYSEGIYTNESKQSTAQGRAWDQIWDFTCCFCCIKQLWSMVLAVDQRQWTLCLGGTKIRLSVGHCVQLVHFQAKLFEQEVISGLRCWVYFLSLALSLSLQFGLSPHFSFFLHVDEGTEDKSRLMNEIVTFWIFSYAFHVLI